MRAVTYADLTASGQRICDDLLASLIKCNYPAAEAPSIDQVRVNLWSKVFADGWDSSRANPAPPSLPKRTLDDTGLYHGTLTEDSPIKGKSKSAAVPNCRKAGCPVMLKASFAYNGKLHFVWVDEQGQMIPADAVQHEGGLGIDEIKALVAIHYDTNEMDRVGGWNFSKVVHWARARLIVSSAHSDIQVGAHLSIEEVIEDVSELRKVHTVQEALAQKNEEE